MWLRSGLAAVLIAVLIIGLFMLPGYSGSLDLNGDGVVNCRDLCVVIAAFGSHNPLADVNEDGIVNIADWTIVARMVGVCGPVASFTYTPSNPITNAWIFFDASSSTTCHGTIMNYAWSFGDGTTGQGEAVSHQYAATGAYTVGLTVEADSWLVDSISTIVLVVEPPPPPPPPPPSENDPPIASFTYSPIDPTVGETVTFDAYYSYDPNGDELTFKWSFSDGNTAAGQVVQHSFSDVANYKVILTVMDIYGATDSTSKIISVESIPPTASFEYLPDNPMVGGNITFLSTSDDPDGYITSYLWDLDGTSIATSQNCSHVFTSPQKFTVTLVVTDNYGQQSSVSKELNLTLRNGDLLLWRSQASPVTLDPRNFWTHVGMYHQPSNMVIEARPEGVAFYPLADWFYPEKTCVRALRVITTQSIRDAAVNFAWSQVGCQYDLLSLVLNIKGSDDSDGLGWYCSELVWAAYCNASGNLVNLDPDMFRVTPDEINGAHEHVELRGEHLEEIPDTIWRDILWGWARCPVDLSITDPDGLVLNKQDSQILGSVYEEVDTDGDGEVEDLFAILDPKIGDYKIQVIPEPNALPTDTYSLEVGVNNETIVLADNVQVNEAPTQPYTIESTNTKEFYIWHYIFEDSFGRGTTLKINTEDKSFKFTTTSQDYGRRKATYMRVRHEAITIFHQDCELKLTSIAMGGRPDLCIAYIKDLVAFNKYLLFDKPGIE